MTEISKEDEERIRTGEDLHLGKPSEEYPMLTVAEVEYIRRGGREEGLSFKKIEKQLWDTNEDLKEEN